MFAVGTFLDRYVSRFSGGFRPQLSGSRLIVTVTFKVVLVSLYILTSLKAWLTVPVTEVCVALDEVALVISDVVSAETLGVGVDVSVCVSEADLVVEDCAFTGVFDTDWASLAVGSCEVGSLPD